MKRIATATFITLALLASPLMAQEHHDDHHHRAHHHAHHAARHAHHEDHHQ